MPTSSDHRTPDHRTPDHRTPPRPGVPTDEPDPVLRSLGWDAHRQDRWDSALHRSPGTGAQVLPGRVVRMDES